MHITGTLPAQSSLDLEKSLKHCEKRQTAQVKLFLL